MKHPIFLITAVLVLLSSCRDQLNTPVTFDFEATAANATMNGDTLIVDRSVPVTFSLSGNAEYISFYSGETGHEYEKRSLTQTPVSDIDSCYLTFTNKPQFGAIAGTLKAYLSTSFTGLSLTNKAKDSVAVESEKWIDLTDSCNLSATSNVTNTTKVSLKAYANSKVSLAFVYRTTSNTAIQPTWLLNNLKIVVSDKKGISTSVAASSLGFNALDMYNSLTPYAATGGTGVWDLSSVAATSSIIKIVFSGTGAALNYDWLVSTPILMTTRIPDTGVAVKTMSTTVTSYQYTYATPGVYKVGFQAQNYNFEYQSATGKTMYVKVK